MGLRFHRGPRKLILFEALTYFPGAFTFCVRQRAGLGCLLRFGASGRQTYDVGVTREPRPVDDLASDLHAGRWIDIDGVVNMRDLGGLPTRDGGAIAPRRLIRSDNLQDLSPSSVDHLVSVLGVRDIVDLRSDTELHVIGDGPLRKVTSLVHHHHSLVPRAAYADLLPRSADMPSAREEPASGQHDLREAATAAADGQDLETLTEVADTGLGTPGTHHDGHRDATFWTAHYLGYLTARPDSVCAALEVVSRSTGATIVHCAAGKDRTGTVVAMALSVAGVPDEVIIEDYALSAERITRILERLANDPVYGDSLKTQPLDDQRPRPETMQAILTSLAEGFGGASGWLRTHGWTDDDLDRLRSRLRRM